VGHDIPQLDANIKALHKETQQLSIDSDFKELLKIIHFKGYTTPAEFELVSAVVNSMRVQVKELVVLKSTVLSASRAIIEEHERVEADATV
jgi:hypothetical protein